MIEYADGTPSSIPQMAHDLTEFVSFLRDYWKPDFRVKVMIGMGICMTFLPVARIFQRQMRINRLSRNSY